MATVDPEAPPPAGSAPAPRPRRRRGKGCFLLAVLVLLVGMGFALYVMAALRWSYSDGERAGYVQKFSRKGWICKTWEGELAMANLPGTMPEVFRFTVRDDATAELIEESMGKRVNLHYEEHRGLPTTCFGETRHFVTGVRPVGP
jgi:hypothetical protein